jgi:V/A-type H+-transporting ATPase subunit K
MFDNFGLAFALLGAALATFLAGSGSAVGLAIAGRSATGVLSEKPERYGTLMLLVVLPSTQGIYGFVIAILVMVKINLFGGAGNAVDISAANGMELLAACLPVAIAGLLSGIHQGKTCAGGINMSAKRPEMAFKAGVLYAAMVEFYAILGFLISLLVVLVGIQVGA